MTTITQNLSSLPAAPDPAADSPAVFSTKAAASVLAQKAMVTELQTWTGQVNTVAGEVNANAISAAAQVVLAADQVALAAGQVSLAADQVALAASQASAAASSAETALNAPVAVALAEYVGRWELLSGALTAPTTVYYGGYFWILIEDIVDVALSTPGMSSVWASASQQNNHQYNMNEGVI